MGVLQGRRYGDKQKEYTDRGKKLEQGRAEAAGRRQRGRRIGKNFPIV